MRAAVSQVRHRQRLHVDAPKALRRGVERVDDRGADDRRMRDGNGVARLFMLGEPSADAPEVKTAEKKAR